MKPLLFRGLAVAAGGLLALALAEVIVRTLVPASRWQLRDTSQDWQVDPVLGWVMRPGLDVTTLSDTGELLRFQTNADGLRPADAQPVATGRPPALAGSQPRRRRVLIVGDSTAVARAVPESAAIHAQLERRLGEHGIAAEVLNAAVEGYSTDQSLLRLRQLLPRYQPDLVLYAFCDNDLGGNSTDTAYGVPKPRFERTGQGGLRELPVLFAVEAIPSLGQVSPLSPRRLAVYRLLRPAFNLLRARLGDWRQQNLAGFDSTMYFDSTAADRADWGLLTDLVGAMRDEAARAGAAFALYPHPALPEVWEPSIARVEREHHLEHSQYDRYALERRLRRAAEQSGVLFCPMIDRFLAATERGPFHLLPRDPHCNAAGYALQAEVLTDCLAGGGLLSARAAP